MNKSEQEIIKNSFLFIINKKLENNTFDSFKRDVRLRTDNIATGLNNEDLYYIAREYKKEFGHTIHISFLNRAIQCLIDRKEIIILEK